MLRYPDGLPPAQREGYAFNTVSPLQRTPLESGRARQRRRFTDVPTLATVRWRFTDVQGMAFEAWFRDALMDGAEYFECPLKVPESPYGLNFYLARFTDIYAGPGLVSGSVSLWDYTATLELKERPILPRPWGEFPDLILHGNIIDLALNQEWPLA
ncbi:hypothetical protein D9M70_382980 [compost metagenome]